MVRWVLLVFPAHAGMNRYVDNRVAERGGVPRTRGDEPLTLMIERALVWCSPHTQG